MGRIRLLAIVAILMGLLTEGRIAMSAEAVLEVKDAHAKALAGEVVLVDIRTPKEWSETGIPTTAHAITMDQPPAVLVQQLDAALGGDRSKPLALICRSGNRSANLASMLRKVGYANVIDVYEGMQGGRNGPGWLAKGLPVRPGSEASKPPVVTAGQ